MILKLLPPEVTFWIEYSLAVNYSYRFQRKNSIDNARGVANRPRHLQFFLSTNA